MFFYILREDSPLLRYIIKPICKQFKANFEKKVFGYFIKVLNFVLIYSIIF